MKKLLQFGLIIIFILGFGSYAFGAFSNPFLSIQLATSPVNNKILQTDGINNKWIDAGSISWVSSTADYWLTTYDKGYFWSTTSADVWGLGKGYLTTSTGLTVANFASPNISQWTNNSGYITSSALIGYSTSTFWNDTDTALTPVTSTRGLTISGTSTLATTTATILSVGTTSVSSMLNIQGLADVSALNIASSTGASMLTVASNGNVGIGTASPTAQLTIGTGAKSVVIIPNVATAGERTAGGILSVEGAGMLWLYGSRTDGSSVSGTGLIYWDSSASTQRSAVEAHNAVGFGNLLLMKSGGFVGIGTTTPISTLSVKGTAGINPFIIASSTNAIMLAFSPAGNLTISGYTSSSQFCLAGSCISAWGTGSEPLYTAVSSTLLRYGTTSDALTEGSSNLFWTIGRFFAGLVGGYNAIFGNTTTTNAVVTGLTNLSTTTIGTASSNLTVSNKYLFGMGYLPTIDGYSTAIPTANHVTVEEGFFAIHEIGSQLPQLVFATLTGDKTSFIQFVTSTETLELQGGGGGVKINSSFEVTGQLNLHQGVHGSGFYNTTCIANEIGDCYCNDGDFMVGVVTGGYIRCQNNN